MNTHKKSFLVVALGVAFEHFDMMLVGLLATSMIKAFVGIGDLRMQLLYAYIGYAIAFLFRPLGALVFGCVGDLYGRKRALISSMTLMATATLSIAFIPDSKVIGMLATLFFFLCRIGQGMAVGGEYGTAMTYAFEYNSSHRSFNGALVVASTHVGGLLASVLASYYLDDFRTVFFIGGGAGFLLLLCRSLIKENYVPITHTLSEVTQGSIKNKKSMVEAIVVASMVVLIFYGSFIYLNEVIHIELNISRAHIFKANRLLLGLWVVLPLCFGLIADKYAIEYKKIMRLGAQGVFVSAPFLGMALATKSYPAVLAAQMMMHMFHMLFCLCTPQFFGELFDNQARNTAISCSYSLGASFTAALAPVICHMSVQLFHTSIAICFPFMLIALMNIFFLKQERLCNRTMLLNSMTFK